jgi:hypothetical protein
LQPLSISRHGNPDDEETLGGDGLEIEVQVPDQQALRQLYTGDVSSRRNGRGQLLLEPVVLGDADMIVGGRLSKHTEAFRPFHIFGN